MENRNLRSNYLNKNKLQDDQNYGYFEEPTNFGTKNQSLKKQKKDYKSLNLRQPAGLSITQL